MENLFDVDPDELSMEAKLFTFKEAAKAIPKLLDGHNVESYLVYCGALTFHSSYPTKKYLDWGYLTVRKKPDKTYQVYLTYKGIKWLKNRFDPDNCGEFILLR